MARGRDQRWGEDLRVITGHALRAPSTARRGRLARSDEDPLEVVDHIAAAIFVVNEDGRPLGYNSAGEELVREGRVEIVHGTLAGWARIAAAELTPAWGTRGDLVALRVPAPARLLAAGARHVVFASARRPPPPASWLRLVFGLTPAEAALVAQLAGGASLAEIAAERGVLQSTTRTQLKSAMAKIGVTRQSELVSVILRTFPDVRGHA